MSYKSWLSQLIDPDYGRAYYGIGRVHHYRGEKSLSMQAFNKAIEVDADMQSKVDDFLRR